MTADEAKNNGDEEPTEISPAGTKRRALPMIAVAAALAIGAGGWWVHRGREREQRTEELMKRARQMTAEHKWTEATAAYDEIASLGTTPAIVAQGRREVQAGLDEDRSQLVAKWIPEGEAAFAAGRWEDAEKAARTVLTPFPQEPGATALLGKVTQVKNAKIIAEMSAAAREKIEQRQWDAADASVAELAARFPAAPEAAALRQEAQDGRAKQQRELAKAAQLFASARDRDKGKYDREALGWLREAGELSPDDKAIAALFQKMSAYTREVHVPGDYPDLQKAIQDCVEHDHIHLAAGTWNGPLVIDKIVILEGEGADTTIIQTPAKDGAAITFGPGANGSTLHGITFRQTSFDDSRVRFPAVLVRGAEITADECRFCDASGHGAAATAGGKLTAKHCAFTNNGWDGVAASGSGSRLELEDCELNANFNNGCEAWDGASLSVRRSHADHNTRNGILADGTPPQVSLEENTLRGNREYGVVADGGAAGVIRGNECRENLLGGMVVRAAAAGLKIENNRAEKNLGPGMVFERGLPASNLAGNTATGNGGGSDTLSNYEFSAK